MNSPLTRVLTYLALLILEMSISAVLLPVFIYLTILRTPIFLTIVASLTVGLIHDVVIGVPLGFHTGPIILGTVIAIWASRHVSEARVVPRIIIGFAGYVVYVSSQFALWYIFEGDLAWEQLIRSSMVQVLFFIGLSTLLLMMNYIASSHSYSRFRP